MPRYFFRVGDHGTDFVDETVRSCPGLRRQRREARGASIARELGADGENYRGYTVVVSDEHGAEIARIPVPVGTERGQR